MSNSKDKVKRETQQAADQQMIDGLTKHIAVLATLLIAGTSEKNADVVAVFQGRIDKAKASLAARVALAAALLDERDERSKTRAFASAVRQAVRVAFGEQPDVLADFGLKPRKVPAPRTPEQKAEAAAKAKATRAARHIMGPKQRKEIKAPPPPPKPQS